MAEDLNKQFFEAKETHRKNYIPKGYAIWILIGVGLIAFYVGWQYFERGKFETLKKEKTNEFLTQGIQAKADTTVRSGLTGSSVLILRGCIYKEFESEFGSTFVVIKNDSSGLGYLTKRIVPRTEYKSSMIQWKHGSSYKFQNIKLDTINGLPVETADIEIDESGQKPMMGKVKIIKKGSLYYVLQIYAFVDAWGTSVDQIARIESSFEIME